MLYAAMVVMTVMGCGDQTASCDVIAGPQKVWESTAACDAAIPATLQRSANAPYPVITAQCEKQASSAATPKINVAAKVPPLLLPEHGQHEPRVRKEAQKKKSLTGYVIYKTKSGYMLVRDGASSVLSKVKTGAKTGYGFVRGGIKTSAHTVVNVTKQSVGYVGDKVVFWK